MHVCACVLLCVYAGGRGCVNVISAHATERRAPPGTDRHASAILPWPVAHRPQACSDPLPARPSRVAICTCTICNPRATEQQQVQEDRGQEVDVVENGWTPDFCTHRIDIDEGNGEMMQLVLTDPAQEGEGCPGRPNPRLVATCCVRQSRYAPNHRPDLQTACRGLLGACLCPPWRGAATSCERRTPSTYAAAQRNCPRLLGAGSAVDDADGWALFRLQPFVRLRVFKLRMEEEVNSRDEFEAEGAAGGPGRDLRRRASCCRARLHSRHVQPLCTVRHSAA